MLLRASEQSYARDVIATSRDIWRYGMRADMSDSDARER